MSCEICRCDECQCFDEPEDEECRCVRVDVDLDDASDCPLHGPHSEMVKRQKIAEAAAEAAYWSSPGWKEVFKED